jgi:hypothetical protein
MRCFKKAGTWLAAGVMALAIGGLAKAESLKLHFDPTNFSDGPDGGGEFEAYDLSAGFQFADPQSNPPSLVTSGYGANQDWNTATQKTFQTFCTEDTVFFYPDNLYYTAPTTTLHDGRVLTAQEAWLFDQFWNGTLVGYDWTFGVGRETSAQLLQLAIWTLANDPNHPLANAGSLPTQSQTWIADANDAVLNGTWGDSIHNVRVLQLSTDPSGDGPAQDQLVEISPEVNLNGGVPLPSSAMAGIVLLAGLGVMQVRRRANA